MTDSNYIDPDLYNSLVEIIGKLVLDLEIDSVRLRRAHSALDQLTKAVTANMHNHVHEDIQE